MSFCLGILGYLESGITAGRPVTFTQPTGDDSQLWKVVEKENEDFMTIRPINDDNLALQIISDFKVALMPYVEGEKMQLFQIE